MPAMGKRVSIYTGQGTGEAWMVSSYVLLLTIITTPIDGVTTQRVPGFNSIQECAEHAAGWGMSQPLQPGSQIIWECQKDE